MNTRVRELQRGEGLIWKELRLRALAETPDAFGTTYESQLDRTDEQWHAMFDERIADLSAGSLLAEVDGQQAGIAWCCFDDPNPDVGHLYSMWVVPAFRRRGAGTALLAYALEWMRARESRIAELEVNVHSDVAISLYASMGFSDTGRREPLREGSSQRTIVMRCALDGYSKQIR